MSGNRANGKAVIDFRAFLLVWLQYGDVGKPTGSGFLCCD